MIKFRSTLYFICHIFLIVLLTALTQIGGIVYAISWLINRMWKRQFRFKFLILFIALYTLMVSVVVPLIVPLGGREKVVKRGNIEPAGFAGVLLNRNYVSPNLNSYLIEVAHHLEKINPQVKLRYLDACFPFWDGFPLLPHLSHNDGNKIDLSLVYEDANGIIVNKSKSNTGYGIFVEPTIDEINQSQQCIKKGFWQYDFPQYLTLGSKNEDLVFSQKGTSDLMRALLSSSKLQKIFIEPHLKLRIGIQDSRIRFQGCHSVRHDDHIHLQVSD